jgi:hypothetical protein
VAQSVDGGGDERGEEEILTEAEKINVEEEKEKCF